MCLSPVMKMMITNVEEVNANEFSCISGDAAKWENVIFMHE